MKIETYFHPRMRRFKAIYEGRSMYKSRFATKGDSKSSARTKRESKSNG